MTDDTIRRPLQYRLCLVQSRCETQVEPLLSYTLVFTEAESLSAMPPSTSVVPAMKGRDGATPKIPKIKSTNRRPLQYRPRLLQCRLCLLLYRDCIMICKRVIDVATGLANEPNGPRKVSKPGTLPTGKCHSTLPWDTSWGAQHPNYFLHLGPEGDESEGADSSIQAAECGPLAGNRHGPLWGLFAHDDLYIGLVGGMSRPLIAANCGTLAANPSGPLDMAVTSTEGHMLRGSLTACLL